MTTHLGDQAIRTAFKHKKAILKFVSPNDAGITKSHQYGYLLPKAVWSYYTPFPPVKERVDKHHVKVTWPDGRVTDSVVTWYGDKSRSEYRLTRFGRDFPFRTKQSVGNLFVLVPRSLSEFSCFVLDLDEDVTELQAELGVEVTPGSGWAIYNPESLENKIESEDECINRHFRAYTEHLTGFPTGKAFTSVTVEALFECLADFQHMTADEQILKGMQQEYILFKMAERLLCTPEVTKLFRDIDDFLITANSILQRRKSRAGRSLENHVERLLEIHRIPHVIRSNEIEGAPDIIIPDVASYKNLDYPEGKLFAVGVKTTCKDRWRQVLAEAPRLSKRYILTTQAGISANQLKQIQDANVTLIVPKDILDNHYYDVDEDTVMTVDNFFSMVKESLS